MLKAHHNRFYLGFIVSWYRLMTRIYFRGIRVVGKPAVEAKPLLLLQNHFSWWDGYWSLYLSTRIFRKKFHVMMLEDELKKRMFLNRCGVYSVKKNNREAIESLNYSVQLLADPNNLVTIYPQGEITSLNRQELKFGKGPEWVARHSKNEIAICFAVILTDYFSEPKPLVTMYLKHYTGGFSSLEMQTEYNHFYRECSRQQIPD